MVVNFVINLLILRLSTLFTGRELRWFRLVLAASEGAVASLVIFAPFFGVVAMGVFKLGVSTLMVLTAYEFVSARQFLKDLFSLFSMSFIFSGTMLFLWFMAAPNGLFVYNGVVYFDITAGFLIVGAVVSYLLAITVTGYLKRKTPEDRLCKVTVIHNGMSTTVTALVDTGNSLCEPFSGYPAIVSTPDALGGVVSYEMRRILLDSSAVEDGDAQNIRLIPFMSVGGRGILPAFKPTMVRIDTESGEYITKDVYIALTEKNMFGVGYKAIINPNLLGQKQDILI